MGTQGVNIPNGNCREDGAQGLEPSAGPEKGAGPQAAEGVNESLKVSLPISRPPSKHPVRLWAQNPEKGVPIEAPQSYSQYTHDSQI